MFVAAAIAGIIKPLAGDLHATPPRPTPNADTARSLHYLWTSFAFIEPRIIGVWFLVAALVYFAIDIIRKGRQTFPRPGA